VDFVFRVLIPGLQEAIQAIQNEPKAFQGTLAKYGKFRNVNNYIVMAGKKSDDLDNTCWVGLSYSKVPGTYFTSLRRKRKRLSTK
jgi:hypothetical protein